MSQGGNNEVARLNVAITGDVTPLAAAAKQAEQVVQQSAAKIEAVAAATSQSVRGMGSGVGAGLAGSGIGGIGMPSGGGSAGSAGPSGFFGLVRGAKESIAPLNMAISLVTRLLGVFGLVAGAGYAITQMLTSQSRAAAASKKEVEELRNSLDGLFTTKPQTGVPAEIREREELFAAVEKQRRFDSDSFARYRAGVISRGQLNSLEAQSKKKLEEELANIRAKFTAEKNKSESDSLLKFTNSQKDAADERAKYVAKILGGEAEEYINAQIEIRKAQEVVDADLRDAKIANIELERDRRIQEMADAAKKIADAEIEQAKRVDAEKRRLMKDFYRDARAAQAEGTMVESFFAGNQGQSFGLANRQRGAIEGQLPSINYQGAE